MPAPFQIIDLKPHSKKTTARAIALGNFDGVHRGHKKIFEAIKLKTNLISCAITFLEPPIKCFKPETKIELITTLEERLELFANLGIEQAIVLDFACIQGLSAIDYLNLLHNDLNCKFIACGLNHQFGKNKEGDLNLLKSFSQIESVCIDFALDENQNIISSSLIRSKMPQNPIEELNKLLGHNFFVLGNLIQGFNLGSKIGFPTLNINYPEEKIKPKLGVYAGLTHFPNKKTFVSAVNFGFSPTLKQIDEPILESHLLSILPNEVFPDIGEQIKIELVHFIRPERHFNSVEELKKQIISDCTKINNLIIKT